MVSTKSMIMSFSDVVTDFVIFTLSDFYFLSQNPYKILDMLIDNNFDAHMTWNDLYEGSGEDYLWNRIEGSDMLWLAKQRMDSMISKVGIDNLCSSEYEKILLKNGLKRINFSTIQYNYLSDEEDSSSVDSDST
jgi:hypothetical protein